MTLIRVETMVCLWRFLGIDLGGRDLRCGFQKDECSFLYHLCGYPSDTPLSLTLYSTISPLYLSPALSLLRSVLLYVGTLLLLCGYSWFLPMLQGIGYQNSIIPKINTAFYGVSYNRIKIALYIWKRNKGWWKPNVFETAMIMKILWSFMSLVASQPRSFPNIYSLPKCGQTFSVNG